MWKQWIKDFLRYLKLERGLAANTLAAYRRDVEKLSAWAEEKVFLQKRLLLATYAIFCRAFQPSSLRVHKPAWYLAFVRFLLTYWKTITVMTIRRKC